MSFGAEPAGRVDQRPRPRGVSVFDLDGTVLSVDSFRAYLGSALLRAPARWPRAILLAFGVALFALGLRDNSWLKLLFLKSVLAGEPRERLAQRTAAFVADMLRRRVREGARRAIAEAKARGDLLALATASPDFYALPLGRALGFDHVLATATRFDEGGRLAPELPGGNLKGEAKRDAVLGLLAEIGARGERRFYSDHHSDLPLLRAVERPIAVNPTGALLKAAAAGAIPIEMW